MAQPNIKPRFQVKECTKEEVGKLVRVIATPNKENGGFEYKEFPEKRRCFMIFFPNGSSLRIRGEEELKRLGFDNDPLLVDMDTGDAMPNPSNISLEEHVSRVTKPSKELPGEKAGDSQMELTHD